MLQEFNLNHKPLIQSVRSELSWWRTWSNSSGLTCA
ncbi:Trp operon leader peptide [Vibrio porteresiae DSM 19223]|uniref:Trp operon leader peptide n=1 Tax=Vibrio porteresiae DSM 19223 TaxID=1123496 RepID=A0ABZ0Q9D7_9VIBR|nr:Trp operon leader peptide [Vibrio porteresiae]WPC73059.1 Trp operon leader peptide [Vibrio porteresiae DSM 19223]